jgi:hypothetical protein
VARHRFGIGNDMGTGIGIGAPAARWARRGFSGSGRDNGSMTSWVRRCACAIAAVAAVGFTGCAPALDWREVRPAGSAVVLLFPCRPDVQDRRVALAGPPLRLDLVACSAGGLTWALAYADVGDPGRVGPALAALRTAAAANIGTVAGPNQALRLAGATPHAESGSLQLAGRRPDGAPVRMRLAVFARGTQVFQATVLGAPAPVEAVDGFFASIRFER